MAPAIRVIFPNDVKVQQAVLATMSAETSDAMARCTSAPPALVSDWQALHARVLAFLDIDPGLGILHKASDLFHQGEGLEAELAAFAKRISDAGCAPPELATPVQPKLAWDPIGDLSRTLEGPNGLLLFGLALLIASESKR